MSFAPRVETEPRIEIVLSELLPNGSAIPHASRAEYELGIVVAFFGNRGRLAATNDDEWNGIWGGLARRLWHVVRVNRLVVVSKNGRAKLEIRVAVITAGGCSHKLLGKVKPLRSAVRPID